MKERPIDNVNPPLPRNQPARLKPQIPDHELLHRIGEGAYGEVWLARNLLGASRAVKVVYRSHFQDNRPYLREYHGIERFEPISRTHAGLVAILHVGRSPEDDYFYYVMELADSVTGGFETNVDLEAATIGDTEGPPTKREDESPTPTSPSTEEKAPGYVPHTLSWDVRHRGRLSAPECVRLGISMSLALGHLHRNGLIHRDVKPSNIIFVKGLPKLADIGLVAPTTEARSLVGTEGFMPPEGPNSPQADLYSLGKVLYEASMGRDRHDFPEPFTTLRQEADAEALLELNAVVLKACAPDLRDRYPSAEEMHLDLALLLGGKSVKRKQILERRVRVLMRVGGAAAIASLLAIGGFFLEQGMRQTEAAERQRAQRMVQHLELQRIHGLFTDNQAPHALAKLAKLLREDPANRLVAEQVMGALNGRSWPIPILRMEHGDNVNGLQITPDGNRVVTCSKDGSACIWNSRTGERIGQPMVHDENVHSLDLSHNGDLVVTASGRNVRVWNGLTGEPISKNFTQSDRVEEVYFSPDGTQLLVIVCMVNWWKNQALLLDAQTGKQLVPPLAPGYGATIGNIEFSPDGTKVAAAIYLVGMQRDIPEPGNARVWDTRTGALLAVLRHPHSGGSIVRFSPDNRRIFTGAVGGPDNASNARLWDANSGELLAALIGHTHAVMAAAFNPDGSRLATGSSDRTACIWDVETGRLLVGPLEYPEAVFLIRFSGNGNRLFTGTGPPGTWHLRDAETGRSLTQARFGTEVNCSKLAPDGERLVCCYGSTVWVLDLRPGRTIPRVLHHEGFVGFANFSPDGRHVVTTTDVDAANGSWTRTSGGLKGESEGRSARVWEVPSGRALTGPLEHTNGVFYADFHPNGGLLVTGSRDRTARMWDIETGQLEFTLEHDAGVRTVRFSSDGLRILTSCWRNDAWLWDARDGRLLQWLHDPENEPESSSNIRLRLLGAVGSADMSPNGRWVATGSLAAGSYWPILGACAGAHLWNADTGQLVFSNFTSNEVRMVRFSSDSRKFVITSSASQGDLISGYVQVFDVATGRALTGPLFHEDQICFAQFSPDGSRLLTGSQDRTARIWDARTGEQLTEPLSHKGEVVYGEFSPDGKRVVTASWWDHAAFLWDARTGLPLDEPLRHEDWVTYATFSPDSRWVVTTSCDRTAKIWEVPIAASPVPDWMADLAEAVGGQHLDENNVSHAVPLEALWALRTRLMASKDTDEYSQWAKWFFTDRAARPISPHAANRVADHMGSPK